MIFTYIPQTNCLHNKTPSNVKWRVILMVTIAKDKSFFVFHKYNTVKYNRFFEIKVQKVKIYFSLVVN